MKVYEEYIAYDEPKKIPEDIQRMTKDEIEAYFKERFPDTYKSAQ